MICENCGAELLDQNQTFCPNCGIPFKNKKIQLNLKKLRQGNNIDVREKFIAARIVQEIENRKLPTPEVSQKDEMIERMRLKAQDSLMDFEVDDNGEKIKLNITAKQFAEYNGRNVLESKKVLIIVMEDLQKIYVWKGKDSPVSKRFISSRIAQELQEDPRFHNCKIIPIDEKDEPNEAG